MNDSRDPELHELLQTLPVPDHAPGFWTRLDVALAREVRPRRRLRAPRLALALGAAAALAALVLIAGPLPRGERTASAAEIAGRALRALETLHSLSGRLTLNAVNDEESGRFTETWQFAVDDRGGFREISPHDGETYDPAELIDRDYGGRAGDVDRGLVPGVPDSGNVPDTLNTGLAATVAALAEERSASVTETTFDGRPAWRLGARVDVDGTRVTVVVDRRTLLPVHARYVRGRTVLSDVRIDRLVLNPRLPAGTFELRIPAGKRVFRGDYGFRRVSLAEAARRAGYRPLLPASAPAGFRLTTVAVLRHPDRTGSHLENPAAGPAVALVYRNGLRGFTVTMRPAGHGRWVDPFDSDRSRLAQAVRLPNGTRAHVVLDPSAAPRLWAVGPRFAITVSGALSRAGLLQVANSVR